MAGELERLRVALGDRYRLERELGRGGMATVYLAEDLKHHRKTALKVLKPELAAALGPERFLREIELSARLHHPHILPLYDSGEAAGFLYYVMPYLEGESLRDRLTREKQLPLDDALRIAREVADGLSYAHSLGLVHRDVKPENILFEAGHAMVSDFGIARAVSAADGPALTETGIAVGTPAYMSPEQASGERQVDARSDVYSLGCVVYEMLAGQPPFTGATPEAILARKSLEGVPSIRVVREAVPPVMEAAITKALVKVPADRFATVVQFADALDRAAQAQALPARGPIRRVGIGRRASMVVAIAIVLGAGGWWLLQQVAIGPRSIRSIAVLPLNNLMGDQEQDYFVEGMHEALITELSKLSALKVISRTSTMRYKDTDKTMPQIARELGVEALVEGSVLREAEQVRITVQLIHARTDRHLWAESYQRALRGILALQRDVARAIAGEIKVALTPIEESRLAAARQVSPEAYEDYLKGQYQWNKLTAEGWEAAAGYFKESIDKDPTYAPAYAMMSFAYSLLGYYSRMPPAVLHSRALAAAERAVALDNSLAEAHASLALVKTSFDWDWAVADRASQEGLRLNPNSTMALYSRAFFLSLVGRHEEAIGIGNRAVDLDPVAPHVNTSLAIWYFVARRYDEAIAQVNKALDLEPDYRDAHIWLSYSYAKKGMFEQAARESAIVAGYRQSWWPDAWILAVAGSSSEARKVLQQAPAGERETPVDSYFLALVLGELGEKDRALVALEQAYQGRTALMSLLKVDPRIDALRDDPRFQDLLRRMSFPN